MDLNYLFYRQQVSLMRADAAHCSASRLVHQSLASHYADRIGCARREQVRSFGDLASARQKARRARSTLHELHEHRQSALLSAERATERGDAAAMRDRAAALSLEIKQREALEGAFVTD